MSHPFINHHDRRASTRRPFVRDERKYYLARRTSHERRIHFPHDNRLRLYYDMLQSSGSLIDSIVLKGPVPTFSRASNAGSFASDGNWALVGGNNLPRFVHDPINANALLGLFKEAEATNICLQSI